MPMTEQELLERDAKRNIAEELLETARDIKSGRITKRFTVASYPIGRVREKSGLSQVLFAKLLGVSVRTLQEWEQGRKKPSGAAQSLLKIVDKHPELLREIA